MNPFAQAGIFLIHVAFNLYAFMLLLRLVLQIRGANFYNPICQYIIKVTQPVLKPLQRFIPTYKGIDLTVLVVLLLVELVKLYLLVALQTGKVANLAGVLVWMLGDLAGLVIDLYFYAVLIRVIISWVSQFMLNPAFTIVNLLTEPLLAPARRFIPPLGMLDLSPVAVIIGLQLLSILIAHPIAVWGMGIAM